MPSDIWVSWLGEFQAKWRERGEKCYGIHFSRHISREECDKIHKVLCERRDDASVIDQFAFGLSDPTHFPENVIGTLVYVSKGWHAEEQQPHFTVELHYVYEWAWNSHVATCHVYEDFSESVEWKADARHLRQYKQWRATRYGVWDATIPQ
ncbi:uncharacterized protein SETTUDRAFT_24911 [Exserohilum turcica Et28A]|uniref:Uncharacterized protein n=1 Tax=Exserohilum turcicum (strain 28A) TaxID=671987 RepID=R0J1Y9_EXST2|nr:uncharacterized protein SETTUDRAFT_24911 [Exserohilum turcica Et28A]EOA90781.1 hypothetical protein SETTUDRAFT_24911 [Exserohilum turcica Et28A]